MAAYRRVNDSRHLQADCQEPGSAPEPYARQSSMGYLYLFYSKNYRIIHIFICSQRQRVLFKPAVTVHQCLNGRAPPYLSEHCIPVSSADTRRHLRSANRHLLAVPRFRLNTYGRRVLSFAGPMAWNSLTDFIDGIQRAAHTVLGVYLKCLEKVWENFTFTFLLPTALRNIRNASCARP